MKTPNMKFHSQKIVIFLATLAITPVAYPSQASSSSASSSASLSSVGTGPSDKANSGTASSISSDTSSPQATAPSKSSGEELRKLGDACRAKNAQRAVAYYQLAAKLGDIDALNNLGIILQDAEGGIKRDDARAIVYFEQAAAANHPDALYNLGLAYEEGQGVTKDIKRAVDYYQKAAEKGHTSAQHLLARLYRSGEKIEQDCQLSLKYLHQAAQQDHADSQFELGLMYFYGGVIRGNHTKAFKWFLASANNGKTFVQGFMYPFLQSGILIPRDAEKATEFFEKIQQITGSKAATRKFIVTVCEKMRQPEPRFPVPLSEKICSICHDSFESDDELAILPCDHYFCPSCIMTWLKQNESCPCCRARATLKDVTTGIAITQE